MLKLIKGEAMPLLLREIIERLASLDETELCDILEISSEDIAERFQDVIEDKLEKLENIVDWD
jgi:hypothetical protein